MVAVERGVTVTVSNDDDVMLVSRVGIAQATRLGAHAVAASRVDLVVRELAWNLVRHGRGGSIRLMDMAKAGHCGIMVECADRGGGISISSRAWEAATDGSLGIGLAAVQRNSTEFTLHSAPHRGTCIRAVVWWASTSS